jgi:hypothetical protein
MPSAAATSNTTEHDRIRTNQDIVQNCKLQLRYALTSMFPRCKSRIDHCTTLLELLAYNVHSTGTAFTATDFLREGLALEKEVLRAPLGTSALGRASAR